METSVKKDLLSVFFSKDFQNKFIAIFWRKFDETKNWQKIEDLEVEIEGYNIMMDLEIENTIWLNNLDEVYENRIEEVEVESFFITDFKNEEVELKEAERKAIIKFIKKQL